MNTYCRTALAGITGLVLMASACAKPEESEFVMSYKKGATELGATEFQVYGKGQRDKQDGIHLFHIIKYQTNLDGKKYDVEVMCQRWGYIRESGHLAGRSDIATKIMVNGNTAMALPVHKDITKGYQITEYFGKPVAEGPFNAAALLEVGSDVCQAARYEVAKQNQANAERLKADREKEIRDNTERVKPR